MSASVRIAHSGGGVSAITAPEVFSRGEVAALAEVLDLSPRQHDLVRHILDDLAEPAIAERLGLSSSTVHTYMGRLYRALGVHSRTGLLLRLFSAFREMTGTALGANEAVPMGHPFYRMTAAASSSGADD